MHSLVAPFIPVVLGLLFVLAGPPVAAVAQPLVADPAVLHLRAARSPDGQWQVTPPRVVRLDRTDTSVVAWRAVPTVPWLTVTPASGAGPAGLKVQADASRLDATSAVGDVVISVNGAVIQRVAVHASVVAADQPPIGVFDSPPDGALIAGPVRLFGWVLDDVGVESVEICRVDDARPGEERCADGHGARVGWAELQVGDRPDVAAALPGFEHARPAAWTAVVSMPVTEGGPAGTTSYSVVARDAAGHVATLGTRAYSVTKAAVPWAQAFGAPAILTGLFISFIVFHRWSRRWLPIRDAAPEAVGDTPRSGPGQAERAALFVILAAFAWLAIPSLDRSLEYDEMYSASQFIVDQSWWTSATKVQTYNNHFGNSVLASAAVRLFGPHEWAVRLPAFLLALGAIVVTWRFGRRLSGPAAGLCAAGLLAASPAFLVWGQTARGYSGLACLAWLSIDAFCRASRTGDPRQARVHTMATALLPLFHLFGVFILAIQYATFWAWNLGQRRSARPAGSVEGLRRLHRSFLIVGVVTFVLLLPSIGGLVSDLPFSGGASISAGAASAAPRAAPATARRSGVQWAGLAVELVSSRSWIVLLIAGALLLVGFIRLPRREASLGAAALGVPLLIMWLAGGSFIAFPRFFSFWIPMLTIFLAAGIVAPFHWQRQWTSRFRTGATLAAGVVTIAGGLFMARTWLDHSRPPSAPGYREWLTPSPDWTSTPAVVVGQDAFMFDFYLGRPAPQVADPAQMDRRLRQGDRLLVAYHNLPRSRPADRLVRDLLMRKCLDHPRGNIVLFECR